MAGDDDRRFEKNNEDDAKKMAMKEDRLKGGIERKLLEGDFKAHFNEVIHPVMEEYRNSLQARGRHYNMQEDEYERGLLIDEKYKESHMIRKLEARAQSDLYRYPYYVPHIRFILEPFRREVGIGGKAGPIEYYELEKITKNFMSNRIIKWIKKVFSKGNIVCA